MKKNLSSLVFCLVITVVFCVLATSCPEPIAVCTYTITYQLSENAENGANNPLSFTSEDSYALSDFTNPSRSGWIFTSWTLDEAGNNPFTGINEGTENNITLYANWMNIDANFTYELIDQENGYKIISYTGTGRTTVVLPGKINGLDVTTINSDVFSNNSGLIEEIKMADENLYVYFVPFEGSPDEFLPISYLFDNCLDLKNITVSSSNENFTSVNGVLYSKDGTQILRYPSGKTETSFSLPSTVTIIADGCFFQSQINSILSWGSVETIEDYAFSDSDITSLEIPSSVKEIGDYAFANCKALTTLFIPESVITMGEGTFSEFTSEQTLLIQIEETSIPPTWSGSWKDSCEANIVWKSERPTAK